MKDRQMQMLGLTLLCCQLSQALISYIDDPLNPPSQEAEDMAKAILSKVTEVQSIANDRSSEGWKR